MKDDDTFKITEINLSIHKRYEYDVHVHSGEGKDGELLGKCCIRLDDYQNSKIRNTKKNYLLHTDKKKNVGQIFVSLDMKEILNELRMNNPKQVVNTPKRSIKEIDVAETSPSFTSIPERDPIKLAIRNNQLKNAELDKSLRQENKLQLSKEETELNEESEQNVTIDLNNKKEKDNNKDKEKDLSLKSPMPSENIEYEKISVITSPQESPSINLKNPMFKPVYNTDFNNINNVNNKITTSEFSETNQYLDINNNINISQSHSKQINLDNTNKDTSISNIYENIFNEDILHEEKNSLIDNPIDKLEIKNTLKLIENNKNVDKVLVKDIKLKEVGGDDNKENLIEDEGSELYNEEEYSSLVKRTK